jgi:hypothetical protein
VTAPKCQIRVIAVETAMELKLSNDFNAGYALGKGEVESSILSGSTILPKHLAPQTATDHDERSQNTASESVEKPCPMFSERSRPTKPLGGKAYGSIGHLPQSRVGPGDWHVHEGQARICLEKPRRGDRVIVSEKLDGACMAVANIDGEIVGLTRAGYRATDGAYEHLRAFAPYVEERRDVFAKLLKPGERVAGEWLAMAHGTIYALAQHGRDPFAPFDIFRDGKRVLREEFFDRVVAARLDPAMCVHDELNLGLSVEAAMDRLGEFGFHAAVDPIEGAVWRVEREGRVDFLAKYVRPDKRDGKYLPDISGQDPIWMWRPSPDFGRDSVLREVFRPSPVEEAGR